MLCKLSADSFLVNCDVRPPLCCLVHLFHSYELQCFMNPSCIRLKFAEYFFLKKKCAVNVYDIQTLSRPTCRLVQSVIVSQVRPNKVYPTHPRKTMGCRNWAIVAHLPQYFSPPLASSISLQSLPPCVRPGDREVRTLAEIGLEASATTGGGGRRRHDAEGCGEEALVFPLLAPRRGRGQGPARRRWRPRRGR